MLKNYWKEKKKIAQKKGWTVIFADYIIAYAFVGVSFSEANFMVGEYLNESRNVIY